MDNFLEIGIVGVLLSLFVQVMKGKFGTNSNGTKLLTVLLSLVVGGLYTYLQQTNLIETVAGVLAAASTVYALILKKTT